MFGLDELISGLGSGSLLMVLVVAALLGVRHATDPDHLVAVSTLLATERDRPVRRASVLGVAWGLGHGMSLLALGIPVVLFGKVIPGAVHTAAEILVGLVIMILAARLVRRWRRGGFHAHEHVHGGLRHRHLHGHGRRAAHDHDHRPSRTPVQAYAIGLVHGIGGSGAVTLVLLASIGNRLDALVALAIFAVGTAISMTFLSFAIGSMLARGASRRSLEALAPVLGALSFAFGAWYSLGALHPL
jgi:ABC-type nickel/cobalt efflux system permease component RcnA